MIPFKLYNVTVILTLVQFQDIRRLFEGGVQGDNHILISVFGVLGTTRVDGELQPAVVALH